MANNETPEKEVEIDNPDNNPTKNKGDEQLPGKDNTEKMILSGDRPAGGSGSIAQDGSVVGGMADPRDIGTVSDEALLGNMPLGQAEPGHVDGKLPGGGSEAYSTDKTRKDRAA